MKKVLILTACAVMAGGPAAWANSGSLACQISLSEFAADAAVAQLSSNQAAAVRQVVDVGRSQCRSSPDLVRTDMQVLRQSFAIGSGAQSAAGVDEFWPANRDELAAIE